MDIEDNSVNEIVLPDCSNYLDPSLKIINNTVYVTYSSGDMYFEPNVATLDNNLNVIEINRAYSSFIKMEYNSKYILVYDKQRYLADFNVTQITKTEDDSLLLSSDTDCILYKPFQCSLRFLSANNGRPVSHISTLGDTTAYVQDRNVRFGDITTQFLFKDWITPFGWDVPLDLPNTNVPSILTALATNQEPILPQRCSCGGNRAVRLVR